MDRALAPREPFSFHITSAAVLEKTSGWTATRETSAHQAVIRVKVYEP